MKPTEDGEPNKQVDKKKHQHNAKQEERRPWKFESV
jgi:hypothetical protein